MEFKLLLFFAIFAICAVSTFGTSVSIVKKLQLERNEEHPSRLFLENPQTKNVELVDLKSEKIEYKALKSDVFYYLYTREHPEGTEVRSIKDVHVFEKNKPTIFITHGWKNNHASAVGILTKSALLTNYDANVFCVDWETVANHNYITAKNSVVEIGSFIAEFIKDLNSKHAVDFASVTLIGHSLGAHISGNIGASLNATIPHIIGLDPAGPLFSFDNTENRLDTSDGGFVEVIHTCGYLLGFSEAIGHSDYFPNGGYSQPGCGLDLTGSCAHSRSYQYFAESVHSNDEFVSYECTSEDSFKNGECHGNLKSLMGGIFAKKPHGTFYLNTNPVEPFGKGDSY